MIQRGNVVQPYSVAVDGSVSRGGIGCKEPSEHVDRRSLSRTIVPQEGKDLPLVQVKAQAINGQEGVQA